MGLFSKLFGGEEKEPGWAMPPVNLDHISGIEVRGDDGRYGGTMDCDVCARRGEKNCATHMAVYEYDSQEAKDADPGGRFRWWCDPHTVEETNKAQDAIREKRGW